MTQHRQECDWFQNCAGKLRQGGLQGMELARAQEHLFQCDVCAAHFETLVQPPEALTDRVLQQTQSNACHQAEGQLAAFIDDPIQGLDADTLSSHVDHCQHCHDLLQVMIRLGETLPQMKFLEPPVGLTQAVLRQTSLRKRKGLLPRRLKHALQNLIQRPRFAMEAAYVLSLLVFLGFRMSANVQGPIQSASATLTHVSESIQNRHVQLGQTLGQMSSQAVFGVSGYLVHSKREMGQAWQQIDLPTHPEKHPVRRLHKKLRDARQLLEKPDDQPSKNPPSE